MQERERERDQKNSGGNNVTCQKLDPNLYTCMDHPGERCINVPLNRCQPKLADPKPAPKKEA